MNPPKGDLPAVKGVQKDEKDLQEILNALGRSDVIDALARRGVTLEEILLMRKEVAMLADDLKRVTGARILHRRHTGLRMVEVPAIPSPSDRMLTSRP